MPPHPCVPLARDFFPTDSGDAYVLVLNDAPGNSLRVHLTKPALHCTMDQKLRVARDLLEALAHCHASGVLHRAFSPATLVLGRPMLQDEDTVLTRRQGAPTTPVALLRTITTARNGSVNVVALDGTSMEISEHEWRRASARFLHHWLVRAPRWMVPTDAPRPPWLTLHGPYDATVATVDDDGRCIFGDQFSNMTYDSRLGLFAERSPRKPAQLKDYDEFDY